MKTLNFLVLICLAACAVESSGGAYQLNGSGGFRFGYGWLEPIDLQTQIDIAVAQGGGCVKVPKGRWLSDPIELKSNVELHLSAGCELFFTDERRKYLPSVPTTYEGIECRNYRSPIFASGATNVAITGAGKIEPQMGLWETWRWTGPGTRNAKAVLANWGDRDVPVKDRDLTKLPDAKTRPPFVSFNGCRDVRLEGFTLRNSPFWCVHLLNCERVTVRGLSVSAFLNNSDGLDIECTRDVLVEDCSFDQGDDVIVLKSGKDRDGRRRARPTENVTIRRCRAGSGHGFLVVGSECSGGVRNVTMEDCLVDGSLDTLFKVKTTPKRGGFVKDIAVRRVKARTIISSVVDINAAYSLNCSADGAEDVLTEIDGLVVDDVEVVEAKRRVSVVGDARRPIRNLSVGNVVVKDCAMSDVVENAGAR